LLRERGIEYEYREDPLSAPEIRAVLGKLGVPTAC
jgi:arsenate reductase-like glutaredoxin family protein